MKYNLNGLVKVGLTLQIFKTALAAGISWKIALLLQDSTYPIFAPLTAILTTQFTIADSMEKGLYRILGVIIGVSVGGFIGYYFSINTISIILVILLGMAISTAFRLNPQIISQVGVSALLVLDYGHNDGYVIARIGETIIGSFVAVIINIFSRPPESISAIQHLIMQSSKNLAEVLQGLVATSPKDQNLDKGLANARKLVQQAEKDYENLKMAIQNFRYTPFKRQERQTMNELSLVMNRVEHMTLQVRGIARSLLDLNIITEAPFQFPQVLQSTAACIEIFGESIANPSTELTAYLKQAIKETRGIQCRYFLEIQKVASLSSVPEIGGIFSDLGRILDEIENDFPV
jgi:uncharacterized membrane protein YgaE (UPF0421/DUF939 family)